MPSSSGRWVWAIIKKPTVSSPSDREMLKCCSEMSASVQCVAMRMIATPRSTAARMSSTVPSPGSISAAIRALRADSTAARIRIRSSVREKP